MTASPSAAANHRAVLDRYCVTCHNQRTKASDLALDGVDVARPGADGEIWEGVVRKLRTRSMPPQGMPRPDEASYNALATFLETELDRAASAAPNPGRPLIRRLNRSEYANSVRDLLALDVDVSSLLPPDDAAFGFDNNADLLGTSPALLEKLSRGGRSGQRARRRRAGLAWLGHVSHPPGQVAGPAHRRSSARIGRWPGRQPQLPARRRVSLLAGALPDEPRSDSRARAPTSDRDHDRRRARLHRHHRRRDGEGPAWWTWWTWRAEHHRPHGRHRCATAGARAGQSRSACGGRDVRAQDRRGHAALAAVPPQFRGDVRFNRPAAHRNADRRRPVQSDGPWPDAES